MLALTCFTDSRALARSALAVAAASSKCNICNCDEQQDTVGEVDGELALLLTVDAVDIIYSNTMIILSQYLNTPQVCIRKCMLMVPLPTMRISIAPLSTHTHGGVC
jgi:hypothetical protein